MNRYSNFPPLGMEEIDWISTPSTSEPSGLVGQQTSSVEELVSETPKPRVSYFAAHIHVQFQSLQQKRQHPGLDGISQHCRHLDFFAPKWETRRLAAAQQTWIGVRSGLSSGHARSQGTTEGAMVENHPRRQLERVFALEEDCYLIFLRCSSATVDTLRALAMAPRGHWRFGRDRK